MPARTTVARAATALVAALLLALVAAAPSWAGRANARLSRSSDPLAGMRWGTFFTRTVSANNDAPSVYFRRARGGARKDFARLLAQPRFRWFGSWIPVHTRGDKWGARKTARNYIREVTQGDRNVGAQIGIFRLEPFERAACRRLPTRAERVSYYAWIREFAKGIGRSRVALVLQPDLPIVNCQPDGGRTELRMLRWTARKFSRLRHTTVYLDAGAADWMRVGQVSATLRRAGIASARGFSLNLTHYDSTARSLAYGRRIVRDLARHGIRGKHFVVSTSMNGRPFTFQAHERVFHAMTVCRTRRSRHCVTLGHPPTTRTGTRAADALLWAGRSWYANAHVRGFGELLRIIRSSPFYRSFATRF